MIHTIKRINVKSVAKQFFCLSLLPSIISMIILFIIAYSMPRTSLSVVQLFGDVVGDIGLAVSIACIVALSAAVVAVLYNLSVRISGGVRVYVEMDENPPPYTPKKLKNSP